MTDFGYQGARALGHSSHLREENMQGDPVCVLVAGMLLSATTRWARAAFRDMHNVYTRLTRAHAHTPMLISRHDDRLVEAWRPGPRISSTLLSLVITIRVHREPVKVCCSASAVGAGNRIRSVGDVIAQAAMCCFPHYVCVYIVADLRYVRVYIVKYILAQARKRRNT